MKETHWPEQLTFSAAAISSLATTVLLVVTLAYPNWTETLFGIDPDHGSGWLEGCLACAAALVSTFAGARVLRSVRILQLLRRGTTSHPA